MSAMREAMHKARITYANSTTGNAPYDWYEAGWQACLQHIKSKCVVAVVSERVEYDGTYDPPEVIKYAFLNNDQKHLKVGTPLYKLEDES